jgi:RecA-family ATPase
MIVLAGSPGAGKSFLSYSLAVAGAVGAPFLGSTPESPFRTLYFDEENAPEDAAEYLRWTWNGLQRPSVAQIEANLWHYGLQLSRLPNSLARAEFMASAAAALRPDLIIIDTATPVCRIEDENDNAEASRAIAFLRRLRAVAAPNCTLLILKHMRIDKDSGHRDIRGAKAWSGECDGILFQEKAPGKPFPILGRKFSSTRLSPQKTRAFGLQFPLKITPAEVSGGVHLTASPYYPTQS